MKPHVAPRITIDTIDAAAASAFYRALGNAGNAQPGDLVLAARVDGVLGGIVRLCVEDDVRVLRGMQIAPTHQHHGVGSALLLALVARLGQHECWCLPWPHLVEFYAHCGFAPCPIEDAPPHLQARHAAYAAAGKHVIVMHRPRS